MDKSTKLKLMRRKKKLFPWLRTFIGKYSEMFFDTKNSEVVNYLFQNVDEEMKNINLDETNKKAEDFFNVLTSFFLHFWWQMHWKSCKKWKSYWKKGHSADVSTNDSHQKYCVRILTYMIQLTIMLTGGDENSEWIGRILTAVKSLPDAIDILYSALLKINDLKKKNKPVYFIILKHVLCCEFIKNASECQTYSKAILLFRRLMKLTKDKSEKSQVLYFARKLKVPSDIQLWLSSLNIEESKDLNYDNLTQELLIRSYPDELLRKLSEILTEEEFCCAKSLKIVSVDDHSVTSNDISKENISENISESDKPNEDLLDYLNNSNDLNSWNCIKATESCLNESTNDMIVNDLHCPEDKLCGEASVSLLLKKESKKRACEEGEHDEGQLKKLKKSHKKKKKHKKASKEKHSPTSLEIKDDSKNSSEATAGIKSSNNSHKKHKSKKNKKKSKENLNQNVVESKTKKKKLSSVKKSKKPTKKKKSSKSEKAADCDHTDTVLMNGNSLETDNYIYPNEDKRKDQTDEDLLSHLSNTDLQNSRNVIKATASCLTESTTNDVVVNELHYPEEKLGEETSSTSELLVKASKKRKRDKEKSEKIQLKKRKKNHKKHKKASKEHSETFFETNQENEPTLHANVDIEKLQTNINIENSQANVDIEDFPHKKHKSQKKKKKSKKNLNESVVESETKKKKHSHVKKSKKHNKEKRPSKSKKTTDYDSTETILKDESENHIFSAEIQRKNKKLKKQFKEKKSAKHRKNADTINPDAVVNSSKCEGPLFQTENNKTDDSSSRFKKRKKEDKLNKISDKKFSSNVVLESTDNATSSVHEFPTDISKKSSKLKKKNLFKADLCCLTESPKEIQPNRTTINTCKSPNISFFEKNSLLNNNYMKLCSDDMASGTIADLNMPSLEETTTFSDTSVSDFLKLPKIEIYRHNSALGIEVKQKKSKKRQRSQKLELLNKNNLSDDEHESESISSKNDLLEASEKSCVSEPCNSPSLFDNESVIDEDVNISNESSETMLFHNNIMKEAAVVNSEFVKTTTPNKLSSAIISQHSRFENITEDTFLTADSLSKQNAEEYENIEKSLDHNFDSFSVSSLAPSVVLKDARMCKSLQKYFMGSEKSLTSDLESDSKKSSILTPANNNKEINDCQELTVENVAKVNELHGENKSALISYYCTNEKQNLFSSQDASTMSINNDLNHSESGEVHSSVTINNGLSKELQSEFISASQSLGDVSGTDNITVESETQFLSMQNEISNYVSACTSTDIIKSNDTENKVVENAIKSVHVQSENPNYVNVCSSTDLIKSTNSKNNVAECEIQSVNVDNENHKSIGTATDLINSTDFAVNCNIDDSSQNPNKESSIQVVINFSGNGCTLSKKHQLVANFDFQTDNNSTRIPEIASVFLNSVNSTSCDNNPNLNITPIYTPLHINSTPYIINNNHNPNLSLTPISQPLYIHPLTQATNYEKSTTSRNCCDSKISSNSEEIVKPGHKNKSEVTQNYFSTSSLTTINNFSNRNECHSQLPLISDAFNYRNKTDFDGSLSSFCNPFLSQDVNLKRLATENRESLERESHTLSESKSSNYNSSHRGSTIYSDASDDDSSVSVISDFTQNSITEASPKTSNCEKDRCKVDSESESCVKTDSEPESSVEADSELKSRVESFKKDIAKSKQISQSNSRKEKTPKKVSLPVKHSYNLRRKKPILLLIDS